MTRRRHAPRVRLPRKEEAEFTAALRSPTPNMLKIKTTNGYYGLYPDRAPVEEKPQGETARVRMTGKRLYLRTQGGWSEALPPIATEKQDRVNRPANKWRISLRSVHPAG